MTLFLGLVGVGLAGVILGYRLARSHRQPAVFSATATAGFDGGSIPESEPTHQNELLPPSRERERSDDVNTAAGLLRRAPFGVFRVSVSGQILEVNPSMVHMLGYPTGESLLSVDFIEEIIGDQRQREQWAQDLQVDRAAEWYDQIWRRCDGGQIRVRVAAAMVRGRNGEPQFVEGFAENVSERAERDELVRRGERMASLGRTLSGVAHEINNPLAAIIGFSQILLKTPQGPENRHALETMLSEAKRAARIVKDLLTISRRQELDSREPVDLGDVAAYVLNTQRYAIETRGIRAELVASPRPAVVIGDPVQLEQVVLNLLVNARQSLERRLDQARHNPGVVPENWLPQVVLRTTVVDDIVRIEISDNGSGIAASDLPHIWDPFWTSRDEGEGNGLGLAVVHGIVSAHGGTIDVRSDERLGTTFSIILPLASPSLDKADAEEPTDTANASNGGRRPLDVLIVDDEQSLRTLLQRIFTERGHAVVTASDGAQALRLAEQASFDVVVCDLRMPNMDGRDVIQQMSAYPTCANTRFILSTGDVESLPPQYASRTALVEAVVAKPYSVSRLLEIVESGPPA